METAQKFTAKLGQNVDDIMSYPRYGMPIEVTSEGAGQVMYTNRLISCVGYCTVGPSVSIVPQYLHAMVNNCAMHGRELLCNIEMLK